MNITNIKIRKTVSDSRMKAVVSIIIDNEFAIHDIKVIEGDKKLFLAMPSRRLPDGTFRDICHPTNVELRAQLEEEIVGKYLEYTSTISSIEAEPAPETDN